MNHVIQDLRARRQQGQKQPPQRGNVPEVMLTNNPSFWAGGWIFLSTAGIVFGGMTVFFLWVKASSLFGATDRALGIGIIAGAITALLYYLLPIFYGLAFIFRHRRRPLRHHLAYFSRGQKGVCLAVIAGGIFYGANHGYPMIEYTLRTHQLPAQGLHGHPVVTVWWHSGLIILAMTLVLAWLVPKSFPRERMSRLKPHRSPQSDDKGERATMPFGLWLGRSTGLLSRSWHPSGLAPH